MPVNRSTIIVLMAVCFIFSSCRKEELFAEDYIHWIQDEENGLKKTKEIDGILFDLQYKPLEYVAVKENTGELNAFRTKAVVEEAEGLQYFTFKVITNDQSDPLGYQIADKAEYFERIRYYSFDIQYDLQLIEGTDTLKCVFSHFERNFGLAPEATMLVGFEVGKAGIGDKIFMYNDRVFNTGPVLFKIAASAIENIPKLKFKG